MLRLHSYRYHRPAALPAALELLAEHGAAAMVIAGGTDLMPNMKHRLFTPDHLVALKAIPELRGIEERGAEIRIGAGETLAAVARDPLVRRRLPALARAAGLVAGPQLRNMGTIGGNLCLDTRCTYYNQTEFWRTALGFCLKKDGTVCHVTRVGKKCVAAHSADTPPVLMTLGAMADLVSPRGARTVPVEDFFVADGVHNTARAADEIVTSVRIPVPGPGLRSGFEKLRQRGSIDFPLLNAAVAMELEGDVVRSVRVVVSALGSRPRHVSGLDRIAAGQAAGPALIEAIAQRAMEQSHPLENITVDPEWRRAMIPVIVGRALRQALGQADPAAAA